MAGEPNRMRRVLALAGVLSVLPFVAVRAALPVVDPTIPPNRETEAVVITGAQLPDWAAIQNVSAKLPLTDIAYCVNPVEREGCPHNHFARPEVNTQPLLQQAGPDTDRILGYRWDAKRAAYVQIPLQVDEMFTRYINNSTSGFGGYSGDDAHFSYAFEREGFRFTESDPNNVCRAIADSQTSVDPVPGLDTDDEIAVMARDAGPEAPDDAPLPAGIEAAHTLQLIDPFQQSAPTSYIYVMKAAANGPKPAFNASNGYVRYQRDANADFFAKWSASYGNARRGPYCDPDGTKVIGNDRRRPNDFATVTTPRYRFRYDGRWVMGGLGISAKDDWKYGPSLVDRWKGRAYAQDPTSEVPCCGFEEEEGNWGESSTLLGEKAGPVRVIRETWGADSGTNVVRRETFYRDELLQTAFLRVHPLPPLGGVYSMWDFNAGRVNRFYNPSLPEGVVVDGKNDEELLGSFDDPCNSRYDIPGRYSQIDQGYRDLLQALPYCGNFPYHFSLDEPDPTTSQVGLPWTEVAGPFGTIVDRLTSST